MAALLPSKRQQSYSKVFKADLFGLMFLSMKIGKRKTILKSRTKRRPKNSAFVGTDHLLIRKKIPRKTIQPFIPLFIHLCISNLALNGLTRKPFSNSSQPVSKYWTVTGLFFLIPTLPSLIIGGYFLLFPRHFFLSP